MYTLLLLLDNSLDSLYPSWIILEEEAKNHRFHMKLNNSFVLKIELSIRLNKIDIGELLNIRYLYKAFGLEKVNTFPLISNYDL